MGDTPFSAEIPDRPPLRTPGGGVAVAAAVETPLVTVQANMFLYLLQLEAICTVIGTTGAIFSILNGPAASGGSIFAAYQFGQVAPVGTRFVWQYPHPWKSLSGFAFQVTPNVATMGTWVFLANGFGSSV